MTTSQLCDQMRDAAQDIGLLVRVQRRESMVGGGDMFAVVAERPADSLDWAMSPKVIAIARSEGEAARRAVIALAAMKPRLAERLGPPPAEADSVSPGLTQVELRLHPDDIDAIADAVVLRMLRDDSHDA